MSLLSSLRRRSNHPAVQSSPRPDPRVRAAALVACERLEDRRLFTVIHGTVYLDENGDQVMNNEDHGLLDWQVYWDTNYNSQWDPGEPTTQTDGFGEYHLDVPSTDPNPDEIPCGRLEAELQPGYRNLHGPTNSTKIQRGNFWNGTGGPGTGPFDFSVQLGDCSGDCPCNCPGTSPSSPIEGALGTAAAAVAAAASQAAAAVSGAVSAAAAAFSPNPVRYGDGLVMEGATDLASDGFGASWGQTRQWSNDPTYARNRRNGNGWVDSDWPTLVNTGAGVYIIRGTAQAEWFDESGSSFTPKYGDDRSTLWYGVADDGSGDLEYVLTAADGSQTRFYDTDAGSGLPEAQMGSFKSYRTPAGEAAADRLRVTDRYTGGVNDGQIKEIQRSVTVGGVTTTESYLYDLDATTGLLTDVKLRRKVGTGSFDVVRQVQYAYYDGSYLGENAFGNLDDLKTATIEDGSGNPLGTWYYRYYTPTTKADGGYAGALRDVFEPDAYARLAATSTTPLSVAETTAAPYASRSYTYDGQHRISSERVAGAGTGSGTDGRGLVQYSYTLSTFTDDNPNTWHTMTTETRPDGTQNVVFTNFQNQVMLSVTTDESSGQTFSGKRLATFYHYNAAGQVDMEAHPSAFSPVSGNLYNASYADLLHYENSTVGYEYLGDDFGQIDEYVYATTSGVTDASTGTSNAGDGDVPGMLQSTWVKRGDVDGAGTADDPVELSSYTYYSHTYTPSPTPTPTPTPAAAPSLTVNPIASETVYAEEGGGDARTTDYTYTWQQDGSGNYTTLPASVATELPVIPDGSPGTDDQNGPGGTDRDTTTVAFDAYGNPAWTKDAQGFITYTSYDPVTGAVLKEIDDVDTSRTSTFSNLPSGWSTPTGGGLHLTTLSDHDALGRPTKVTDPNQNVTWTVYNDAEHEIRTYHGWNDSTGTVVGPVEIARTVYPVPGLGGSMFTETLLSSAPPDKVADPLTGKYHPTGAEEVGGGTSWPSPGTRLMTPARSSTTTSIIRSPASPGCPTSTWTPPEAWTRPP